MSSANLMYDPKKISEIIFRRKKEIFINDDYSSEEKANKEEIAEFLSLLSEAGYFVDILDKKNINNMKKLRRKDMQTCLKNILETSSFINIKTKPLYENFPSGVENTSEAKLYIDAVAYALSGFDKEIIEENNEYKRNTEKYKSDRSKIELTLSSGDNVIIDLFNNILSSPLAPSKTDVKDISQLTYWSLEKKFFYFNNINLKDITVREKIAVVLATLSSVASINESFIRRNFYYLTTTDILRILSYFESKNPSLPKRFALPKPKKLKENTMFIVNILELSNAKEGHYEDIKKYKEEWKYILRSIDKNKKTPLIKEIEDRLYKNNGKKIETWLGKEESLYLSLKDKSDKDKLVICDEIFKKYVYHLYERPGEFLRRSDKIFMLNLNDEAIRYFMGYLYSAVLNVDAKLSINYYNFLQRRKLERIAFFKDNSKLLNIKEAYPTVKIEEIINTISLALEDKILRNLDEKEEKIKLYYDKNLFKNIAIPTSNRFNDKNYSGLTSGSQIDIKGHDYIRIFTKWKGFNNFSTDIDLASIAFKAIEKDDLSKTVMTQTCAYYNLKTLSMIHSGDVRDNNGEEYIDIDLGYMRLAGFDGILVRNTHFSGTTMPEIKTGACVLKKENKEDGTIFKQDEVIFSSIINGDFSTHLSFYIDLKEEKIYWLGLPLKEGAKSSFDRDSFNKYKNFVAIQQTIAPKFTLEDFVNIAKKSKNVILYTKADLKKLNKAEKEDLIVMAKKNKDDFFIYYEEINKVLL